MDSKFEKKIGKCNIQTELLTVKQNRQHTLTKILYYIKKNYTVSMPFECLPGEKGSELFCV